MTIESEDWKCPLYCNVHILHNTFSTSEGCSSDVNFTWGSMEGGVFFSIFVESSEWKDTYSEEA